MEKSKKFFYNKKVKNFCNKKKQKCFYNKKGKNVFIIIQVYAL